MAKTKKTIRSIVANKEFLVNFLSTATYGSYWFTFGTHQDTPKDIYENAKLFNECCEEIWADVLLNGGFILVNDVEEEKDYKVSLKDIVKGFKTFMIECPRAYADIMEGNDDYFDDDALIQVILFGEVVYE